MAISDHEDPSTSAGDDLLPVEKQAVEHNARRHERKHAQSQRDVRILADAILQIHNHGHVRGRTLETLIEMMRRV